jgi:hypothetical protein
VPAEEFDISKLTPLDVLILLGPLLAYGVFYAIREQYSVRANAHVLRAEGGVSSAAVDKHA